jgi:short-subunit dehydrogenase
MMVRTLGRGGATFTRFGGVACACVSMSRVSRKPPRSWHSANALVTGGSSGIGVAVGERLAREGVHVTLVARRVEQMDHVVRKIRAAGGQATAVVADLSTVEGRIVAVAGAARHGAVDILINNAGHGWYGNFADMSWPDAASLIEVNVAAAVHLTHLVLPGMRAGGRGGIVCIGSISAHLPVPGHAVYAATKAFLDSFTTALHRELHGQPILVSAVHPGPVRTEFVDVAAHRSGRRAPVGPVAVAPERVADAVWQALTSRPRRRYYVPRVSRATGVFGTGLGWTIDLLGLTVPGGHAPGR